MIEDTAIHQKSDDVVVVDDDDDDHGDRTAQRASVATRAPLGASLLELPLFPVSGNTYRGSGANPVPGLLTGVRAFVAGRTVG